MSTAYESHGRMEQKRRTRDALIAAARAQVARGETPTVERAAETASISRTTAYRYFPSQRALLAAAHPETAVASLLPEGAPDDDVAARLDLVVETYTRMTIDNESQYRTMLRLSLEATEEERSQLPLRQGRAIAWIQDALAPLRTELSAAGIRSLALAIRSATGIEAFVWLTDVARLSREEAVRLMRFSAHALLGEALRSRESKGTGTGRELTRKPRRVSSP